MAPERQRPVLSEHAEFEIGGQRVNLEMLLEHFGSKDKQELSFSGGHVGMFVSGKPQGSLAPRIAEWVNQRV